MLYLICIDKVVYNRYDNLDDRVYIFVAKKIVCMHAEIYLFLFHYKEGYVWVKINNNYNKLDLTLTLRNDLGDIKVSN